MKRVIEPEVIIIFGKLIKGMTGQFILFEYKDSFIMKDFGFKQLSLFPDDQIITIEEAI